MGGGGRGRRSLRGESAKNGRNQGYGSVRPCLGSKFETTKLVFEFSSTILETTWGTKLEGGGRIEKSRGREERVPPILFVESPPRHIFVLPNLVIQSAIAS